MKKAVVATGAVLCMLAVVFVSLQGCGTDEGDVTNEAAAGAVSDAERNDQRLQPLEDERTALELLESGKRVERIRAARELGEAGDETAIPALIDALNDALVRDSASAALVRIGPPAVDGLIGTLESENPHIRLTALDTLGRIGDEDALPHIEGMLNDDDAGVRRRAYAAVGSIRGEPPVKILAEALESDRDYSTKARAARLLGLVGDETAVPALKNAVEHPYHYVRRYAAESLGRIGDEAAVPALNDLLLDKFRFQDRQPRVRFYAAEALAQIGGEAARDALLDALENKTDREIRVNAARGLATIGDNAALPALMDALEAEDRYVRLSAVKALHKMQAAGALDELKLLAAEDDDLEIRRAAENAVDEISGD